MSTYSPLRSGHAALLRTALLNAHQAEAASVMRDLDFVALNQNPFVAGPA